MARFLVKVRDRYLEWSTVADAPVTGGMTADQLREYWIAEHGAGLAKQREDSIRLADETGTSNAGYDWRSSNRAGPEATSLTEDEIFQVYCLDKPLDPETIRRKIAERQERESRLRPMGRVLGDRPSVEDITAAFATIRLDSSLAEIEAVLGRGTVIPRKRGSVLLVRWVLGELVVTCHFEKASGKLCGRQLSPNYGSR